MSTLWKSRYAQRTLGIKSSAIRELLKVTQKPEIISFRRRAACSRRLSGEALRRSLPQGSVRARRAGSAIRSHRRLPAAARDDRPQHRALRHPGQAGERADHLRLAAGARSDRQAAHQSRRPHPGRSPDLSGRAAGVQRLRRAVCFRCRSTTTDCCTDQLDPRCAPARSSCMCCRTSRTRRE